MEQQKRDLSFYWKLFYATLTLSAFTFGGGYVIVPLMKERFVDDYHWIDEEGKTSGPENACNLYTI